MKDTVVAIKYAKALFAQAQAKNELRAAQQGLEEFVRVSRIKPSLKQILMHPGITADEKRRVTHSALGEYVTPMLEVFFELLVTRRRLDLLTLISLEFHDLVDQSMGVQSLKVKTAFALGDAQQKELQAKLEKWLSSKVRMDIQVDPSLIGGLIIQTRDHVLDQSLKGQLKKLEQLLTA